MTTKQKIIAILQKYSYTQELQSGENANIIDEDDFETIAMEIESLQIVKCDSCDQMVKMISTGEVCPNCFC
jgi:rubrerythrin